ncbi:MAG TPA: ribosome maturation factor RimP [Natronosporangium sp.]
MAARGRNSGRSAPTRTGDSTRGGPARTAGSTRGGGQRGGSPTRTGPARGANLTALRDRLTEVIAPVTEQAGFDLERVNVTRLGRRHRVQVIIDRDGGVGLDAIAEVSHAVSQALDAAEAAGTAVVPGEYVLEVSSPGVDRPLTEPRHWRRNIGRLVKVRVADGQTVTGRITDATADWVALDVDQTTRQLPYQQLGPGRIQVELRPLAADDEGEGDRT